MSSRSRAFSITVALLLVSSLVCLKRAHAQEDSFQGYGPVLGMKMHPTPANPFIGTWMARIPAQGGNGTLVGFIEYLPNGNFRSETTVEGGFMNRAKIQIWGHYVVQRVDQSHFILGAKAVGIEPKEFCVHEGDCKPNPLPDAVTETDEMVDAGDFHSKFTSQGVAMEADVHSSYLPLGFGQPLAESINLPVSQAGPPMPDPDRLPIPTDGDNQCDNLQQRRICVVRGGRMVADRRGCQVCVDLDEPDQKLDQKPPPPD